jgi:hypothetical protein
MTQATMTPFLYALKLVVSGEREREREREQEFYNLRIKVDN